MKYLYNGIIFLSIYFIFASNIIAQPYLYKSINPCPSHICYEVLKINLTDGRKNICYDGGDQDVMWDNTQSWVFCGHREYYFAFSPSDTSQEWDCPFSPNVVVVSNKNHKLFVLDQVDENEFFSVFNLNTKERELSFEIHTYTGDGQIFLSQDENKLYFTFYDTVDSDRDDKTKLATLSVATNQIIKTINIQDIGYPGSSGYVLSNGKKGKGIITSYFDNSTNDKYYKIYDFDNGTSSPFIYQKGYYYPKFTNDGKYLVLVEIIDSLNGSGNHTDNADKTGKFLIFNFENQKLVKTIQLPPEWIVYTFDNFPNNIYYFNDSTEKAITLNIDSLVNMPSGPTDSPKVIMYNLGTTVFTADFINRKIKYEVGNGFTIIKFQSAVGDKLIYNEYDENNNLLGVFSFDKGYIKGSYIKDKSKKTIHFNRIDKES